MRMMASAKRLRHLLILPKVSAQSPCGLYCTELLCVIVQASSYADGLRIVTG